MKNANGDGSVYKLSGRRRKPWVAAVTMGMVSGKQVRHILGTYETKKEANAALAKHRVNPVSSMINITLGELYEEWSDAKYEKLTKATADNYRAAWNYLSQHSKVQMKDLRTLHMQKVIDTCHKEGMSKSSLQKIRTLCGLLCNFAVENDIVVKNYAEFLELPKTEKVAKGRFNDLEIRKIEQSNLPWADTILILIYTGMRVNEMLGLTRFNIDLDRQLITGGGIKTDAGKSRVIPIHPKLMPIIKKWYDKGGEKLICDNQGKAIKINRYRNSMYYPVLKELGLPKLTPHCCRHTFGSIMAEAGVDTISIQQIIGHSDYNTTANIYTKLDTETLKKAINKL